MSRAIRYLAVLGAGLLALGALAFLLAPSLIERAIRMELSRRGIETVQMDVTSPRLGSLSARQVRIGGDGVFTADEVTVQFRIPELLRGQIRKVRLVRPHLIIRVTEKGRLSFGSLDPLLTGGREAGGERALPAPIEIIDGTITVAMAAGAVSAGLDGVVALETAVGPLKLSLAEPWLTAELTITLSQSSSGIGLAGQVYDARISHPLVSALMHGPFTATLGTDAPALSAELNLTEVTSPLLAIGKGAATGDLSLRARPGEITGDLRLADSDGRLAAAVLGDLTERLRMSFDGTDLTILKSLSNVSVDAVVDLYPKERRVVLVEPARISGLLGPDLRALLPDSLQSTFSDERVTLTAESGLELSRLQSDVSIRGQMSITQAERLSASFNGSLGQTSEGWSGSAETRLEIARLALPKAILRDLSLTAPLRIMRADERTEVHLTGDASLSFATIEIGSTRFTTMTMSLQEADRPMLLLDLDGSQFALIAGAGRTAGRLGQAREPFTLAWRDATFEGNPGAAFTATISGGRVALSRLGWEAGGVGARLTVDETAATPPELSVSIARLAQSGGELGLTPVVLEGNVHPTDARLRFDFRGRDTTSKVRFALKGDHDLSRNRGSATFALDPLRFSPGGLQPVTVLRALGDVMRDATGTLTADGKLTWSNQGLTSDLELAVEKLSFLSSLGPVLGLDGRVRLNGIAPLATPPGQRITAASVQAAVPMSDLALQFGLREGRFFDLEKGGLRLAGGRMTILPVTLDLGATRNTVGLEVTDVQLSPLFDLIGLDGLSGTGRLEGKIPIAFQDGDFAIVGGRLDSQEPGQIGYDPAEAPLQGDGESIGLVLAALRSFHYDRLTLDLDRELGGETQVKMHVAGRNPDFYGGHPVELNLNLSGKLDRMLVQGLAGFRVHQTLQDRLRGPLGASSPAAP